MYSLMNTCIVFASLKLENFASINNVRMDTTMYWIPIWSPEEITQFKHLLPEAFPVCKNYDIAYLLHYFGGTIGNMMHKDRKSKFKHLKLKCSSAAATSVLATSICQDDSNVIAEYSSLVENEVNEDYELAGMRYISSFVMQEIMGKYLLGKRLTFAQFWDNCAARAPGEYGKIYERHLPFFMSKGDKVKIPVAEFEAWKSKGYFNDSNEVTMKFNDYVFKKEKSGPYCVEVGCLVQMYQNCPSIDFYTIQENAENVTAVDVTSDVYDKGNYANGNDKTYTVYAIQATVGKEHDMEFNKVAAFLQGIEKQVNKIGGESNGKEILKNSLLGGKVSVKLLYLEPLVHDMFDAPGQNELRIPQETRGGTTDVKVRRGILMKLKVMYEVMNPYEGLVKWCEEEKNEETQFEEEEEGMDCK